MSVESTRVLPRSRSAIVAASAVVAISAVAAGCGSGSSSTGAAPGRAAGFIPSTVPMYAEVSTDLAGAQWKQAESLGTKFPAYPELMKKVTDDPKSALAMSIIKANIGKHAAFGVPNLSNVNRADASALASGDVKSASSNSQVIAAVELLAGKGDAVKKLILADGKSKVVGTHESVEYFSLNTTMFGAVTEDTLVIGNDEKNLFAALDAHKAGGDRTIAGSKAVTDQLAKLPSDVLMQAYVNVGGLVKSAADQNPSTKALLSAMNVSSDASVVVSVSAEANGIRMKGISNGAGTVPGSENFQPALTANVPSDAVAYVGFHNLAGQVEFLKDTVLKSSPDAQKQLDAVLPQLPALLGVSLDDLKALTTKEHALVVTKGSGSAIPGVALILEQADGARAGKTLDGLRGKIPTLVGLAGSGAASNIKDFRQVDLGGVRGWELPINVPNQKINVAPTYLVDGNLAYLGLTPDAVKSVRKPVSTLANNPDYVTAAKQVPGSVSSVMWANVPDAIVAIRNLAKANGSDDPFGTTDGKKALANLEPVKNVIAWSTTGDDSVSEAFITIK